MTLLDLSQVTSLLLRLLVDYVEARLEPGLEVRASADPPDLVTQGTPRNVFSVHLHHVREVPESRASVGGGAAVPIRTSPMGLALRYLITAHHADPVTGDPVSLAQQKLLGYALKTLHDHPLVDARTTIRAGEPPLLEQLELVGNRFELEVLALDAAEAAAFFASEARVAPPAVFVEVRGVALDPEAIERVAAPVLALGDYVFTGGAPMLLRSRSELLLAVPGSPSPIRVPTSPARVPLAEPPSALPLPAPAEVDPHRLVLEGSGLWGELRTLRLRGRRRQLALPLEASAPTAPAHVQAWRPEADAGRVAVVLQRLARDRSGVDVELVPGVYEASVELQQPRPASSRPDTIAVTAPLVRTTNVVPFAITPRVIAVRALGGRRYRLQVDGAYLARPAAGEPDLELELSIGGEAVDDLRRVVAREADGTFPPPPADRAAYEREADAFVVWLREGGPLVDLAPGRPLAIHLVVDGAPGLPAWIEAP